MQTNEIEFQELYTAYRPQILRYLTRLVGEGEAEDLAQEVFIKAGRGLKSYRGEASLATWIYRIAANAAVDHLRSPDRRFTQRHCSPSGLAGDDERDSSEPDPWSGETTSPVEQLALRRDMSRCFQGLLEALPEASRIVFTLSEMDGLRNEEIAEALGISLETVKIRLHRARRKLRASVMAHCDFYWFEGNEFVPDLKKMLGELPEVL